MTAQDKTIGVAVLGMGNVGSEVVRIIEDNAADLRARVGAPVELRGVAVRDLTRPRKIAQELITDDPAALVARDDVDLSLIHI